MKIKNVSQQDGRWYKMVADYPEGGGKRKLRRIPLTRVAEGEVALHRALATLNSEAEIGNCPSRIQEFTGEYLKKLSKESRKEYGRVYLECEKALREFNTEDVTPSDILELLKQPGTQRMKLHYKQRLSTFFIWCALKNYTAHNPCAVIKLAKPKAKRVLWTSEVWHTIRAKLEPMMQVNMDLCFLLYQRNTDVRKLMLPQVDEKEIRFTPAKTLKSSGANVTIPITSAVRAVLDRAEEMRKGFKIKSMYVVCKPDGQPYTATGISSAFERAQRACTPPLKGFTTKSIRPYAASAAKRSGYTLEQIKVGLAHMSIETTEGYMESHAESVSAIALELPRKLHL